MLRMVVGINCVGMTMTMSMALVMLRVCRWCGSVRRWGTMLGLRNRWGKLVHFNVGDRSTLNVVDFEAVASAGEIDCVYIY